MRGSRHKKKLTNLENGRRNASVAEEVEDQTALEVGDTNVLDQSKVHKLFHAGPSLVERVLGDADVILAIVGPSGRVSDGGVDVFEGNGYMEAGDISHGSH